MRPLLSAARIAVNQAARSNAQTQVRHMGIFSEAIARGLQNTADDLQHEQVTISYSSLNPDLLKLSEALQQARSNRPEESFMSIGADIIGFSSVALCLFPHVPEAAMAVAIPTAAVIVYGRHQARTRNEALIGKSDQKIKRYEQALKKAVEDHFRGNKTPLGKAANETELRKAGTILGRGSEFELHCGGEGISVRAYVGDQNRLGCTL